MMPRRNKHDRYEPADVTNFDGTRPMPRIGSQWTPFSEAAERKRQAELDERRRRQIEARQNGAIDWAICLVPGCGLEPAQFTRFASRHWRDHKLNLPLCIDHLGTAYAQAKRKSSDPLMVSAVSAVVARDAAKVQELHESAKQAAMADKSGHIYYVRLNGLIKVGWSRALIQRLRSYGPSVEVLAYHPGTRDDETLLHRQLRPVRAKGHEWYHDGPILAGFIAQVVSQHGVPDLDLGWSKPKPAVVAGKRAMRYTA